MPQMLLYKPFLISHEVSQERNFKKDFFQRFRLAYVVGSLTLSPGSQRRGIALENAGGCFGFSLRKKRTPQPLFLTLVTAGNSL